MDDTEDGLRRMFDLMTADQPAAPPDRAASVRSRTRAHRRNWAVGLLAVVMALGAGGLAVAQGRLGGATAPAAISRAVPRWALPWPDHRNGTVPQPVLSGAVLAWRHDAALTAGSWAATAPSRVIWYVGQTVARGEVVAVVFEVDSPVGRRLVAGWATASEVTDGQPAWSGASSPWVLYDVPAPRPVPGLAIGLNVHGTTTQPNRNPDAWIVVLAAPDVRGVAFGAPGPPRRNGTTAMIGVGTTSRGFMTADVGQIGGRVQLTKLQTGHRNVLAGLVSVGVRGAPASTVPQLAWPAPLNLVFHGESGQAAGQGDVTQGTESGPPRPITVVVARCYGPAPLRILIGNLDRAHPAGTIACDDIVHVLRYHGLQPRHGSMLMVRTSELTSYRVAYGT